MIHFGLTAHAPHFLYGTFVLVCLLSLLWRPVIGTYFLIFLLPLQTARYHLIGFPLGQSVVDITLLCASLGLVFHLQTLFIDTRWTRFLLAYTGFTFLSLCWGSTYLGRDLPFSVADPRLADWKNYMVMPYILLLVVATVQTRKQVEIVVLIMCAATAVLNWQFWNTVSGRDFNSFSYDLRDAGGMGYAGVNGFAAFQAQVVTFLLALAAFKTKRLLKWCYAALASFSLICLMYSFSRGAYLALVVGALFLGLLKQRKLLLLVAVLGTTWTTVLPRSVQQRVLMTYDAGTGQLDHSVALRIDLWNEAVGMIRSNPVLGAGFDTYAYTEHVHEYKDSHNYYLKTLAETGIIGLLFLLCLMLKAFDRGYTLFRDSSDPFLSSLGLGLAGWVVCSGVVNCFGDRWSFLQVNGYMWVLAGLAARGSLLHLESTQAIDSTDSLTNVEHNLALQPSTVL